MPTRLACLAHFFTIAAPLQPRPSGRLNSCLTLLKSPKPSDSLSAAKYGQPVPQPALGRPPHYKSWRKHSAASVFRSLQSTSRGIYMFLRSARGASENRRANVNTTSPILFTLVLDC